MTYTCWFDYISIRGMFGNVLFSWHDKRDTIKWFEALTLGLDGIGAPEA